MATYNLSSSGSQLSVSFKAIKTSMSTHLEADAYRARKTCSSEGSAASAGGTASLPSLSAMRAKSSYSKISVGTGARVSSTYQSPHCH